MSTEVKRHPAWHEIRDIFDSDEILEALYRRDPQVTTDVRTTILRCIRREGGRLRPSYSKRRGRTIRKVAHEPCIADLHRSSGFEMKVRDTSDLGSPDEPCTHVTPFLLQADRQD